MLRGGPRDQNRCGKAGPKQREGALKHGLDTAPWERWCLGLSAMDGVPQRRLLSPTSRHRTVLYDQHLLPAINTAVDEQLSLASGVCPLGTVLIPGNLSEGRAEGAGGTGPALPLQPVKVLLRHAQLLLPLLTSPALAVPWHLSRCFCSSLSPPQRRAQERDWGKGEDWKREQGKGTGQLPPQSGQHEVSQW